MTGREVLGIVERLGWERLRQRGSHLIVRVSWRVSRARTCPSTEDIPTGTLKAIERVFGTRASERLAAMKGLKNYVAVYEHDATDDVWLVHIKGVVGCQTFGRSIRQAETRIREALAAWLDKEPDALVITPELPADLAMLASRVSQARFNAERAGADAQRATIEAVQRLTKMGLSRRDAADLLGISHQRVQQLLGS